MAGTRGTLPMAKPRSAGVDTLGRVPMSHRMRPLSSRAKASFHLCHRCLRQLLKCFVLTQRRAGVERENSRFCAYLPSERVSQPPHQTCRGPLCCHQGTSKRLPKVMKQRAISIKGMASPGCLEFREGGWITVERVIKGRRASPTPARSVHPALPPRPASAASAADTRPFFSPVALCLPH